MTLEEAKGILKETLDLYGDDKRTNYGRDALKIALNYIENESIPKEKVREKIKERESKRDNAEMDFTSALFERDINLLEELLGEE